MCLSSIPSLGATPPRRGCPGGRERGAFVIALTSLAYSRSVQSRQPVSRACSRWQIWSWMTARR